MNKRIKLLIKSKILKSEYNIETDMTEILLEGNDLPDKYRWEQGHAVESIFIENELHKNK